MKEFRQFINERIVVPGVEDMFSTQNAISSTFHVITQFHIFHLITRSFAQHSALGEFYSSMVTHADALAETYIALGGNIRVSAESFLDEFDIETTVGYVRGFRRIVELALIETNRSEFQSINDILIDVQKSIDTLLYKLGLN